MRDFSKGYFQGYSKAKQEYMNKYIHETFPKKTYSAKPRYFIRKRRPNEIFFSEIVFALLILFMLVMIYMNYMSNLNFQKNETAPKEVDIKIGINKELSAGLEFSMAKPGNYYSPCM